MIFLSPCIRCVGIYFVAVGIGRRQTSMRSSTCFLRIVSSIKALHVRGVKDNTIKTFVFVGKVSAVHTVSDISSQNHIIVHIDFLPENAPSPSDIGNI